MVIGRPRNFDSDQALDRALQLFWRKGYEGTSLADLTEAMGINRPSMYATFGNKEALFRKALDRYTEGPVAYTRKALQEPTACAVVERLLYGAIDVQTDPRTPLGCLITQGALVCGEAADPIRQELIMRRMANEAALCQRLEQAKSSGDLPIDANPTDLARYIVIIIQGLAVQAVSGVSREELQRIAEMVLRAWPM